MLQENVMERAVLSVRTKTTSTLVSTFLNILGECSPSSSGDMYGYNQGKPCFFLKLNQYKSMTGRLYPTQHMMLTILSEHHMLHGFLIRIFILIRRISS